MFNRINQSHITRGSQSSFQNTNTPDVDLERDIIGPEVDGEIVLGMESTELNSDRRFRINISTIMISAFIFLAILAWFDFIQTTFYIWLAPESTVDLIPASIKLWYAIAVTVLVIILIFLIYYYAQDSIK